MKPYYIFIDIDGTLVGDNGYVPQSAVTAIRTARQNGHRIFLSTGRSKPEIYDFILDIGIDGIIGAGGGFVENNGEMLYHQKMPEASVRHILDFFITHDMDYYLESNDGLFTSPNFIPQVEKILYGEKVIHDPELLEEKRSHPHPFIAGLTPSSQHEYHPDINKICFLEHPNVPFEKILTNFSEEFEVHQSTVPAFGENSGELAIKGVHKAKAIQHLLEKLDHPLEQTFAIGDGLNDVEMLLYCSIGVAMDNAKPGLKSIADDITDSVENDGLAKSFKKYGLV
ncbi:Cof-type HAD-IIB family hydrolase [Lacticigenium naphthae]|uniref:Cof-type HAD-IIB family hydrolase n=1 Tax=Lacticigenium naphthae TaxID=515351 RepID=UPI000411D7DA|nr:Cof-type HAD-IIB family hydrolase [Lacticigenium naphthae]